MTHHHAILVVPRRTHKKLTALVARHGAAHRHVYTVVRIGAVTLVPEALAGLRVPHGRGTFVIFACTGPFGRGLAIGRV